MDNFPLINASRLYFITGTPKFGKCWGSWHYKFTCIGFHEGAIISPIFPPLLAVTCMRIILLMLWPSELNRRHRKSFRILFRSFIRRKKTKFIIK